jgi:hypothetical protein
MFLASGFPFDELDASDEGLMVKMHFPCSRRISGTKFKEASGRQST